MWLRSFKPFLKQQPVWGPQQAFSGQDLILKQLNLSARRTAKYLLSCVCYNCTPKWPPFLLMVKQIELLKNVWAYLCLSLAKLQWFQKQSWVQSGALRQDDYTVFSQAASLNRWSLHGRSIPQINRNTTWNLEVPADDGVTFWHMATLLTPDLPPFGIFFSHRPSNLLLDQSNVDITTFRTTGDWLNGVRTAHCKEIFTGVEYSSCDTIAKISTE